MRFIPTRASTAFTKVPHSITFSNLLTPHQKLVWIMLDANCYNQETEVGSATQLAEKFGLPARGLQRTIKELIEMGFITKKGRIHSLETEPKEEAESTLERKERRMTGDEKLRLELRDIWNKYKPKNAPSMRNFTPERLKTLRVYVERFNADEQVVLRRVCDGSNADDFRKDKSWDFVNIFGDGEPTEEKQGKVEKVYNLGCSGKGRAAVFNHKDDQCWLDWFHAKGHKDKIKVVRLEMHRSDAWNHDMDNEGDGTIYIYTQGERLVHWTDKERSVGVSYLPTAK